MFASRAEEGSLRWIVLRFKQELLVAELVLIRVHIDQARAVSLESDEGAVEQDHLYMTG